ncbi:MAG: response regulator [Campylobacterales bacterium]|nr:response regulator [Campylobacterales bacterium]
MQEKIAKLKSIKMLFVEDEEDLATIISDTLNKLQANFDTAANGQIALDLFKTKNDYDLIVTDINMPVMNGLELIKNVREVNTEIPVIIMSAHTEPEYIKSAEELGVDNYLLKPFDFIKFINLVYQLDFNK